VKEVFTDKDTARVGFLNDILNRAGIPTVVKNWHGSNITEIPIPLFYPTICLLNPDDESKAQSLLKEFHSGFKAERAGKDKFRVALLALAFWPFSILVWWLIRPKRMVEEAEENREE